jgi:hypothetical protein
LANRRLQPLGHLTADLQVYVTSELAQNVSVKKRRFYRSGEALTLLASARGLLFEQRLRLPRISSVRQRNTAIKPSV